MTESHAYSNSAGVVSVKIQLQTSDDKYQVCTVTDVFTVNMTINHVDSKAVGGHTKSFWFLICHTEETERLKANYLKNEQT